MPDPLAALIASKLDRKVEDVDPLLTSFAERLTERIRIDKIYDVDGFGSFEWMDGRFHFTPADGLLQLVNYRYRSLGPVSVSKHVTEEVVTSVETAQGSDHDGVEKGDLEPQRTDKLVETREDVLTDEWETAIFPDHPGNEGETKEDDLRPVPAGLSEPKRHSPRKLFYAVPVLLFLIVAAGYLILSDRSRNPSKGDPAAEEIEMSGDSGREESIAQSANPPNDDSLLVLNSGQRQLDEIDPSVEESKQSTAEIVSEFSRQTTGYTLVIGSSFSRGDAENELRRYTSLGLPLAIIEQTDDGVQRLRLVAGQFNTVEDARIGLQNRIDELPEGTWIRRISLLFSN